MRALSVLCFSSVLLSGACIRWSAEGPKHKAQLQPSAFSPDATKDYHVFVKQVPCGHEWLTWGLASHTETMFCEVIPTSAELEKIGASFNHAIKEMRFTRGIEDGLPVNLTSQDTTKLKPWVGNCTTSGFKGLGPTEQDFDDATPIFYDGPHGTQNLTYVGRARVDVDVLLKNMKVCGNWENMYYDITDYNCNYYTKALLTGMDLPRDFIYQGEQLFFHPWIINPGYFHVATSTCKGVKCTAGGGTMLDSEEDSMFATSARTGKCDSGICHDGGQFQAVTSKPYSCK